MQTTLSKELCEATLSPAMLGRAMIPGYRLANHIRAMDVQLRRLSRGEITRLILTAPPRSSKTYTTGRAFPVWHYGENPQHNLMLWTATDGMAQRSGKATKAIAQKALPMLWGRRLDPNYKGWAHWKIEGTPPDLGECIVAGVGSGRTMGAGADLGIIDDYFRNAQDATSKAKREAQEEWFLSGAMTRLAPGGRLLLTATRWHIDDLIGVAIRAQELTGERWEVLDMAAIAGPNDPLGRAEGESLWPERWPAEHYKRLQKMYAARGYAWMYDALYDGKPPEALDAEWPAEYFGDHLYFDQWPDESEAVCRAMTLDPSLGRTNKSDYSAFVTAVLKRGGEIYVDANLDRRDLTRMAREGIALCDWFKPSAWGVESNGFAALRELIAEIAGGRNLPLASIEHHTDKHERIKFGLTPLLAQKRLRFKRGSPGVSLLLEQMRQFPSHAHDDGPDALEMAAALLRDMSGRMYGSGVLENSLRIVRDERDNR